jgi:phospholipase/carboxylesterase
MWIFTRGLPQDHWIFAPRAPVPAPGGGYGWLPHEEGWPGLADFQDIAGKLASALQQWARDAQAPSEPFDIIGFSQGAAMAYALAAYFPQQVNQVVALAGFLPPDAALSGRYSLLSGKKIYVAHGTKDQTIPVHKAQEAVQVLQSVGAEVLYCESSAGHKLSMNCLKGLEAFLA